jgi:hypothetical protein
VIVDPVADILAGPSARAARREGPSPAASAAPTPKPPNIFSAGQLMAMAMKEPRWAVPGVLCEGATLLAGKPKIGKSWLGLGLAVAVASGGRALGQIEVEAGDVLYLALEDTLRRLQGRLQQILGDQAVPSRLSITVDFPRMDQGGSDWLQAWLGSHPGARLVVVDTLARIRSGRARNGNLYDEDYQAIALLKRIADNAGAAILIITHTRKMASEDPLDSVSGTLGQTGAADSTLVLKRERGRREATLFLTGRDIEEQELAIRWDQVTSGWALAGDTLSEERQAVIDVLRRMNHPIGPGDLAKYLGRDYQAVKLLAWRMAEAGQILKTGRGLYSLAGARATEPRNLSNLGNLETFVGDQP